MTNHVFGLSWYCTHCGASGVIGPRTLVDTVERYVNTERMMLYLPCSSCGRQVARSITQSGQSREEWNDMVHEALSLTGHSPRVRIGYQ
jgi:transcription elongation factor Elf1